jgi:selenocysteine-specific elongation factor
VRGIRTQDQEASTVGSGERCALNIAGMELANIQRGDWLSATPPARYRALSVELHVSKDFPRAVKHWTPVHVYHATHHCQGRLALAPGQRLEPGQTAQIDLILDEPIYCHRNDRLILRDHGLDTTLGGGSVIYAETIAPRRRQDVRRQQHIAAYALKTPKACLAALLQGGIADLQQFRNFWHLTDDDYTTLMSEFVLHHSGDLALSDEHWLKHKAALLEQFTASPDQALRENQLLNTIPSAFRQALLNELVQDKTLTHTGGEYKLLGQALKLPEHLVKLWDLLEPALAHNQAPSSGDLAKRFNIAQVNLERGMNELVKSGLLIHVANHRYYLPNQLKDVAKIVKRMAATEPLTVRGFRDETGIGRNVAIEVLEYFDSKGFTRRQGNDRIILNPTIFD